MKETSVSQDNHSQDNHSQDFTQWSLPDSAIARLGKGSISGDIAFSPDGSRLAVSGSIGIWIYDAYTGAEVNLYPRNLNGVSNVVFSLDGRTIASWSVDGHIRLWDVITGEHMQTLTGHTDSVECVAFSPDGRTIASGSSDSTIRLWDAITGVHKRTLAEDIQGGLGFLADIVHRVVFSPDGGTIASEHGPSYDHTIHLWDAITGVHKLTVIEDTVMLDSLVFSRLGRLSPV